MTENVLDTRISEPSMTAGEEEMLLFALERSRATFAWKCGGLDAQALRRAHPPSTMTLAGLLKHLTLVEHERTYVDLTGEDPGPPWNTVDFEEDPDWAWRTAADDSPEQLYAWWEDAVVLARRAWAQRLDRDGLDGTSRLRRHGGEAPNLRRILCDTHDEYARHVGHVDLFREAIDGLVGEDPPRRGRRP